MNSGAEFDIIVYGATGFTGRLVAEHLAGRYGVGGEVKWAMAGRSLEKLQQRHEEMMSFRSDLQQAEQSVRQAVPRVSDFQPAERKWAAPERYGYIHTLASRGMPVEEIAAILTVSPHEVSQVLNLARIRQGGEGAGEERAELRFPAGNR